MLIDFKNLVGERIKQARKKKNLTHEDLFASTGVTQGALSKIERGVVNVSAENLFLISRALGVTVDWLITGGDEESKLHIPDDIETLIKFGQLTERDKGKVERYIHELLSTNTIYTNFNEGFSLK